MPNQVSTQLLRLLQLPSPPVGARPPFPDTSWAEFLGSASLLTEFAAPLAQLLVDNHPERIFETSSALAERLVEEGVVAERLVELFSRMGEVALERMYYDAAAAFHRLSAQFCKGTDLPRDRFVRCVLDLSRTDFMRGSNALATAEYQAEALAAMDGDDVSGDEALLLMYAGLVRHFMGFEHEGHDMRQLGYERLQSLGDRDLENRALPLIGWHIYLQGRFNESIEFYEDMVLAIENRRNMEVAALAYPPVIYSYMFRGEFNRGLILNEIIHNQALERKDHTTAILMQCIGGRVRVAGRDGDDGGAILYRALAESTERGFVWGQYYALFALCLDHFQRGQIELCRKDLIRLNELKAASRIGRFYSSPFILDALREIERQGLGPVPGMRYEEEVQYQSASFCIHLRGVGLRHQAVLARSRNAALDGVLDLMERSVAWLKEAGNPIELGHSYVQLARIFREEGQTADVRAYATLARQAYGGHAKTHFPNELLNYVEEGDLEPAFETQLRALSLELNQMVDASAMVLRLVTRMGRVLKVESGGFAVHYHEVPVFMATQNMSRTPGESVQSQRMGGWVSYARQQNAVVTRFRDVEARAASHPDFGDEPPFVIAIPFRKDGRARAALYFESHYRGAPLSAEEMRALEAFVAGVNEHLMNALFYQEERRGDEAAVEARDETAETADRFCFGTSERIQAVHNQISLVAKTRLPVLLTGETGVGKEIFAKEIHRQSGRTGAFVRVNCGAIPETLVESEMFGYERGSFTGAGRTHKGYFEQADGGTLFLDEIGDLPLASQVKLLRVLQEQEIVRIGGSQPIPVDFRLVAATNKTLRGEVELGRFRNDLYYRLNVLPIVIPPLRQRRADIAPLIDFFIRKYSSSHGLPVCRLSTEEMARLLEYDWPGNIRELENVVQRRMLMARSDGDPLAGPEAVFPNAAATEIKTLEQVEREHILRVLSHCNGRIAGAGGAAALLGLKRTTLISRMSRLGIR